jgi:sugar/nucleoside kinase (ribokinase family)
MAFDAIQTPMGKRDRILGGSVTHFSVSAAYLTDVSAVAIVGRDFPDDHLTFLDGRGIDVSGVERSSGDTFFWRGKYEGEMNSAETLEVRLNVLDNYQPKLAENHRASPFVFLANGDPRTQLRVASEMRGAYVVADTMNLWISTMRPDLDRLLARVDGIVMNDGEARMYTGESTLMRAASKLLAAGPRLVIIKKGEHGALAVTPEYRIMVPAFPTEALVDPTGAGDSFAGGVMGYLALCGEVTQGTLRKAMRYGTVCASYQVEDFGLDRHRGLSRKDIERRLIEFEGML